jgi:hypothetical protein
VFRLWTKLFSTIDESVLKDDRALFPGVSTVSVQTLADKELETWANQAQMIVLHNRICLFTARKLRDYQQSGIGISMYILSFLILALLTICCFTGVNFAIYKLEPKSFRLTEEPSLFTFFYYSFQMILFQSISAVHPLLRLAEIASMAEEFMAFCLLAIMLSLLFAYRNQRVDDALNDTIAKIKSQGEKVESRMRQEWNIDVGDAIAQLRKAKSSFLSVILYFTDRLD